MKRVLLLSTIIFAWAFAFGRSVPAAPEALIQKANALYAKKQYDSALVLYQNVLEQGWEAPELYYNIGNVYFRKGNLAKAILFYERAHRLDPTNDKIAYNLKFANQFVQDKFDVVPEFFFRRWWHAIVRSLDSNTWAWISILSFVLTLICFYIFLFSRKLSLRKLGFYLGLVLFFVSIFSFFSGLSSRRYFTHSTEAIIMSTSSVRSSPSMDGTELYILHDGVKVRILSQSDGWYEVRLPNGSIGWIKKTDLEKI